MQRQSPQDNNWILILTMTENNEYDNLRHIAMSTAAPLNLHQEIVLPEWIDYNGHMNVAYYVLAFDHATDALLDFLGMDSGYRAQTDHSVFVMETHVTYEQELMKGNLIRCDTQILNFDHKRIHYFHYMYADDSAGKEFLAATSELILIHVDLSQRRGTPMPASVLEKLDAIMAEHKRLPRPSQAGRIIGIRSKTAD